MRLGLSVGLLLVSAVACSFVDGCTASSAPEVETVDAGAEGSAAGIDPSDGRPQEPDAGAGDSGANDDAGARDGGDASDVPQSTIASCVGLAATCGGAKDCCASNVIPGGTFNRSNDPSFPATVSDFKLDVYEVTVGRFRRFVDAGKGTQASPPAAGDGAHPKIASSGWDAAWNSSLVSTTAALRAALKCNATYAVWTDAPGANETLPVHCVTWFDAFAFCAWDGARLPTETEWNYAAAGGSEQREFPWGASLDSSRASYDCTGDGSAAGVCALSDILPVGSKSPLGDGRWGQADLSGNIEELVLDWYQSPYRLAACTDCADLQPGSVRTFRGGAFPNDLPYYLRTSARFYDQPLDRDKDVGFRCAR